MGRGKCYATSFGTLSTLQYYFFSLAGKVKLNISLCEIRNASAKAKTVDIEVFISPLSIRLIWLKSTSHKSASSRILKSFARRNFLICAPNALQNSSLCL